jgi:hypothetical protein
MRWDAARDTDSGGTNKEVDMILSTVLSLTMLGQVILPGSKSSLEEAQEKAQIIVVAEHLKYDLLLGLGAVTVMVGIELKPLIPLKGKPKEGELKKMTSMASNNEVIPKQGEEYIYFIEEYKGRLTILKILPKTETNIEVVKKEIKAKEKK